MVGTAETVDPSTPRYDANGSLSKEAVEVIALPVVDSSARVHFPIDARTNAEGEYSLPSDPPSPSAMAGGIGAGTIWFALDENGRALQRRFNHADVYVDIRASGGRLRSPIALRPEVLDSKGDLVVRVYTNAPSRFAGESYDRPPVDLTGDGGVRLIGDGRLVLNGNSDFTGGVIVDSGELVVAAKRALGTGDVEVRGGTVTLEEASLPEEATLTLAQELEAGAFRLDFSGTNKVRALRIGKTVYTCGTWGAPGSGTRLSHPVFSGTGTLALTAGPPGGCTQSIDPQASAP